MGCTSAVWAAPQICGVLSWMQAQASASSCTASYLMRSCPRNGSWRNGTWGTISPQWQVAALLLPGSLTTYMQLHRLAVACCLLPSQVRMLSRLHQCSGSKTCRYSSRTVTCLFAWSTCVLALQASCQDVWGLVQAAAMAAHWW